MLWSYENTFCTQRKKKTTLFNNSSPLRQRSTILENIRWMQAAYTVLCQPRCMDTSSTFVYSLIWTKTAYPCGAADTELRTLLASSGYSPKWSYADAEETNCWIKSLFFFFAYKKYYRSFITLRLNHWWQMDYSDDVFYTFLGLDSVNCLDSHKIPGFHPKYLKLCSKDKQSFYGFGTTWG